MTVRPCQVFLHIIARRAAGSPPMPARRAAARGVTVFPPTTSSPLFRELAAARRAVHRFLNVRHDEITLPYYVS